MLKSIYLLLILSHVVLRLHATTVVPSTADKASNALPTVVNVGDNVAAVVAASSNTKNCLTNSLDQSLYCRGSRAIRNVINNLNKSDKPIVIVRGLEIVRSSQQQQQNVSGAPTDFYSNAIDGVGDGDDDYDESFLGRFSQYLRTHELNIKFSDLLAEESERFVARDLAQNGLESGAFGAAGVEEARKKDKGQGGILMAMALMFGKVMAVMGLGGIGALALKALGIAMAALMMAGIVGLKSLSEKGGGGHESSHSVQYLTADGHHHRRRRRRSLELMKQLYQNRKRNNEGPYRGWLRGDNHEHIKMKQ